MTGYMSRFYTTDALSLDTSRAPLHLVTRKICEVSKDD